MCGYSFIHTVARGVIRLIYLSMGQSQVSLQAGFFWPCIEMSRLQTSSIVQLSTIPDFLRDFRAFLEKLSRLYRRENL